ncbi:MAG TPA: aminodeoxychorismate lyase [Steroidobacteraceae bacterium]|nr:aminodeoxychorismate lyase [Steroidobacteraceae bacterium]
MRSTLGKPELVLIDGEAVGVEEACVPALERGLHYGDGLFETLACIDGQVRLLPRHLERLADGCERLGLAQPERWTLERELAGLAAATSRAVIKLLLTRGSAAARGYGLTGSERPRRVTLRYPWPAQQPALAEAGVRVRLARLRLGENPALAGVKHCNRLEQILARREWDDPHIAEALMFSSSGALISGIASNVFLVRGSKLLTPLLDRCGVAGVMRAQVLEIARASGVAAEERRLDADDLERADELFITNALTGIRPVVELEGARRVAGPTTRHLQRELAARLAAAESSPAKGARAGQQRSRS